MKRRSLKSIKIKTTQYCEAIYPKKKKSAICIGLKLDKNQAIDLARALLLATKDWDEMDLTAYKKDNHITITAKK
jgi:hypothetical protein